MLLLLVLLVFHVLLVWLVFHILLMLAAFRLVLVLLVFHVLLVLVLVVLVLRLIFNWLRTVGSKKQVVCTATRLRLSTLASAAAAQHSFLFNAVVQNARNSPINAHEKVSRAGRRAGHLLHRDK